ncbi:MmcQ/YjbR family DNA-binding protein [Dubosiella newyorkensis]|nr:MmcQ/YjbR family DNA-binding protein [Dubosiella newyorkensis]
MLQEKGIYPGWHMNKKTWISLVLDGTLTDETIQKLIEESYQATLS